ncbi:MAG: SDR family oxidoreductase [Deltaproteobacteria bacterium]|nr:SDR family oxidoreductase [Deltaproteobacteria bacterium]
MSMGPDALADCGPPSAGRVLVTGASRGIGRAIAEELLLRGAHLAVVGRAADPLLSLSAEAPDRVTIVICDLSNASARSEIVPRAAEALGGLDAFVSAAGVIRYQAVPYVDEDALREQLEVNLVAPTMLAQAAARVMQRGGSIVQITSTLARRAAPSTLAYAISKAGLEASVRGLALELAPRGVRVNAVCPGVIDTSMIRTPRPGAAAGLSDAQRVEEQLEELRRLQPLGRLGASAEVAEAALYLLDASFVTGTCLTVDGGLLAG